MSSSPDSSGATATERSKYEDAWTSIYKLVDSGKSWSGTERNCCFLNTGGGRFADVSAATGLDFLDDGRGVATTDWDFDGKLDFWVSNRTAPRVRFLRNASTGGGQGFVMLQLRGTLCNRDAIGARVELHPQGDSPMIRTVRAGDGYISQSSKWLHFGLGAASAIDKIVVRWPGGETETFPSIAPNSRYVLVQGSAQATRWEPPRNGKIELAGTSEAAPEVKSQAEGAARTILVGRIPVPGDELSSYLGKPVLVNLWSRTCSPCLAEMNEWSEASDKLRRTGLKILALNVDAPEEAAEAQRVIEMIGFPFDSGRANDALVNALEVFHRAVLERRQRLPVPSSFLIDKDGAVCAIYKGRLSVPTLLKDVALLKATPKQRRASAVPYPGRWTSRTLPPDPRRVLGTFIKAKQSEEALAYVDVCLNSTTLIRDSDAALHGDLHRLKGNLLLDVDRVDEAVATYRRLIELAPTNGSLHREIGQQLVQKQHVKGALAHLNLAVKLSPDDTDLRLNVAMLHSRSGQFAEAIPHLRALIKERSGLAPLHFQLALALQRTGDERGAITAYRRVYKLAPTNADAATQLAWLLATSSDANVRSAREALAIAEKLCAGEGQKHPGRLAVLAAAHAASGDRVEAIAVATRAHKLATASGNRALAKAIDRQLQGYRDGANQPKKLE